MQESEGELGVESMVDQIIRMSDYNFQRLPMLEIIAERQALLLQDSIESLIGIPCEAKYLRSIYQPLSQAVEGLSGEHYFAEFVGTEIDGRLAICVESRIFIRAIEKLLGADIAEDGDAEERVLTGIEARFAQKVCREIASGLSLAFRIACNLQIEFSSEFHDANDLAITEPTSLCVNLFFSLTIAGSTSALQIVIPYDMLDPIRENLDRMHLGDKSDEKNHVWHDSVLGQISKANVSVEAELVGFDVTLGDLRAWNIGDVINLWVFEDDPATLIFNGVQTFKAEVGKHKAQNSAVKITAKIQNGENNAL